MPIKKEIVYPIFLECCQFTNDIFWENIFEDLAYGKTPYGSYITKGFLCCNYKDKEFSYKIVSDDAEKVYTDVYNILSKRLGILSGKEKIKKKIDFHEVEKDIKRSRQTWKSIRKKNIKDLLIEHYVIDMKKKHKLTLKQSKYLLTLIFMALIFKAISSKDISYENGRITNITGIKFNTGCIIVKRNIYHNNKTILPQVIPEKKMLLENWAKYIKKLKKIERSLDLDQ